jgi:hypothetical protein
MRAVFGGILRNARPPCLLTGLPTGKASLEVGRRTIGVAVGFDHKPSDNLDLLNVPRRVDHPHVGQYEAHASHRVLLGQTLPYGHLGDFGWHRTKNRNRRKRREPTQLCSIAEQSSREPVSELALWVVLLYEVKEAYEFVTMQPRHVFLAETFAVFP